MKAVITPPIDLLSYIDEYYGFVMQEFESCKGDLFNCSKDHQDKIIDNIQSFRASISNLRNEYHNARSVIKYLEDEINKHRGLNENL